MQGNQEGLLECRGRIQGHYPIILPDSSPFTRMLVHRSHIDTLHRGVALTMTKVRELYWVPCLGALVKQVLRACSGCKRFQGMALATPPPGFLPTDRTEGSTPFEFATQPQSPDIQALEGCSGSRSLSHSRREHRCWLEIFRNTELIYWTNFPFRSLNFKFYRACHSSVFSLLEKNRRVWEIIQH